MPKLGKYNPLLYDGTLSSKQRDEVLKRFEKEESVKVLLMSLKAGGLGLTLTVANYVVHFDSWWNPAVMSQADEEHIELVKKRRFLSHPLFLEILLKKEYK